ncbi:hypothetical protein VUR80DRAFT_1433 [Thermomyces stellatus]
MPQPPTIPPRPAKSQDKGGNDAKVPPKVPPRPTRHLERKVSQDRFAPSPLNEGFPKQPKSDRPSSDEVDKFSAEPHDPQERPGSVAMPSLGEEGSEYAAVAERLQEPERPEQTRTIGGDMKLHAPKPSLPVQSAKQRVAAISRIASDKAVSSIGIGKPTGEESLTASPKVKKSTTSALSTEEGGEIEEEHGIPEIGQRVPMDRTTGDVQAPSPSVEPSPPEVGKISKYNRRPSSQGAEYHGRHGHGAVTDDRLEKEYYEKHPEELQKELARPYHEHQNDYAMSSSELNEIIRDTADHGSGLGTSSHQGTPSEDVAYQAHEEFTSRIASPRFAGATKSGLRQEVSPPGDAEQESKEGHGEDTIHVNEPPAFTDDLAEGGRDTPILADDEVAKHPPRADLQPAVEPSHEPDEPTSRPTSRHAPRPPSAHKSPSVPEAEVARLEDVKEYKPLFDDEGNEIMPSASPSVGRASVPPRFPSKDVWEDAPSSVHQTAEVNTQDAGEPKPKRAGLPERDVLTPAQAFAKHQEELAEREAQRMTNFVPRGGEKGSTWLPPQAAVPTPEERQPSPSAQRRFPSRDVWEDAPESHLHKTTVSSRQTPESPVEQPEVSLRPVRSTEKPAIPARPRPKKTPSDEARAKPAVSDKPKPQIPARPVRNTAVSPEAKEAKEAPPVKPKPAVPARPVGGKIAALQAGFMSDLNKRLQLGPMAPKKEEAPVEKEKEEEKVEAPKKPLSDARKGRARGPQRRAPARSPAVPTAAAATPAAEPANVSAQSLSLSVPQVVWSVDPEDGDVLVKAAEEKEPKPEVVEVSPKVESPELKLNIDTSPVGEPRKPSEASSADTERPKEASPKETSPKETSPKQEPKEASPKEESPKDASPKASPQETSPKEAFGEPVPVVASSPVKEPSTHVIPAKADLAAVEPLDEDTTEGERLGELQAQAKGRSAEREMDDPETSPVKEA